MRFSVKLCCLVLIFISGIHFGCEKELPSSGYIPSEYGTNCFFAVDPFSGEIAITSPKAVSFFDPDTLKLIHRVEIPSAPDTVSSDFYGKILYDPSGSSTLFVLGWKDVSIIDSSSHALVYSFENEGIAKKKSTAYGFSRMLFSKKNNCFYLSTSHCCTGEGPLMKFDFFGNKYVDLQSINLDAGAGFALNHPETKIYIINPLAPGWRGVTVYRADNFEEICVIGVDRSSKEITQGQTDMMIIAHSGPVSAESEPGNSSFTLIDSNTDSVIKELSFPGYGFSGMAYDKKRNKLYATMSREVIQNQDVLDGSDIACVDMQNESISFISTGHSNLSHIALSPDGNTIYTSANGPPVYYVDLDK